tara:strand:- start:3216 stop:4151 length:936 start_codon:yes stop_codon:yes gene_type:complete
MKINLSNIKKAKKLLDNENCIAIPTETVYGLAANAYSDKAVQKIFKLKKRPKYNPLIVHYHNIRQLKHDCHISKSFLRLFKKLSPGPITYILRLKKNSKISKLVTNNKNTLAIRFPKHNIAKYLLKSLNYPLAAPSANISSRVSAVCALDVKEEFGKKIKYILEGGKSSIGIESTIVSLIDKPKILRLGGLENSLINRILNQNIKLKLNSNKVYSPGQMELHYSPGLPIKLNIKKSKINEAHIILKKPKKLKKNLFFLSEKGDLKEAAKNLYSTLRKIKKSKFKKIVIEKISKRGIGKTINDRLLRASKFK